MAKPQLASIAGAVLLVCCSCSPRASESHASAPPKQTRGDAEVSDQDAGPEEAEEPDAATATEEPSLPEVVFEPVEPSAAPQPMPAVAILSPRKGVVLPVASAPDQEVKLDLKGWKLKDGNHVQLILDNRPYLRIDDPKRVVRLRELGPAGALGEGQHFVAALLARGNLETVKPSGRNVPAAVVSFFVGKKTAPVWKEGAPMLVYSSPQSGAAPPEGLLVDFYVLNAPIAQGKTVVHAAVSGPGLRAGESLTKWTPWRIKNARPGLYAIQLGLYRFEAEDFESESVTTVKYQSKPVPGPWSSVTGEFTIK